MTPTPEDLKLFAEAGRWKFERRGEYLYLIDPASEGPHPSSWGDNKHAVEVLIEGALPDFLNNLQACVDVLERACSDNNWRWEGGQRPIDGRGYFFMLFERHKISSKCLRVEIGKTLQIAIINAVNAARRKDDV